MARRSRHVFAYEGDSEARGHLAQGRILNHVANLEIAGETPVLDDEDAKRRWSPDFVRIGAEAGPAEMLAGGKRFFEKHSPLVMVQLSGTDEQKMELVRTIEAMGYHTYRALPRAPQLVPRQAGQPIDALERNLFAAKQDRAVSSNREASSLTASGTGARTPTRTRAVSTSCGGNDLPRSLRSGFRTAPMRMRSGVTKRGGRRRTPAG